MICGWSRVSAGYRLCDLAPTVCTPVPLSCLMMKAVSLPPMAERAARSTPCSTALAKARRLPKEKWVLSTKLHC